MKWLHGRDNLDTFLQEANSFHSTIQFTAEVSNDKHVFLDTQSRLDEDRIFYIFTLRPFSWLRFIDDIDMKWLHGRDNLDTFLQEANSFHSTIQFTAEVSNDKHVFLDTQSRLDEDRIFYISHQNLPSKCQTRSEKCTIRVS